MKTLKLLFLSGGAMAVPTAAWACLSCNRPLQVSVMAGGFWWNVLYMALPLLVVGVIAAKIYKMK